MTFTFDLLYNFSIITEYLDVIAVTLISLLALQLFQKKIKKKLIIIIVLNLDLSILGCVELKFLQMLH